MPIPIIDQTATALQGKSPKLARDMPHGLLPPPPEVRAALERERTKHTREVVAGAEVRLLNEWTIGFSFEQYPFEVLYRPTPQGPEVLAVGFDEIFALTDGLRPEKMQGLDTWMP